PWAQIASPLDSGSLHCSSRQLHANRPTQQSITVFSPTLFEYRLFASFEHLTRNSSLAGRERERRQMVGVAKPHPYPFGSSAFGGEWMLLGNSVIRSLSIVFSVVLAESGVSVPSVTCRFTINEPET